MSGERARVFAFYVSGHGYGHATRASALVGSLLARGGALRAHVRTCAPHWLFTEDNRGVECSRDPIDVGMLQPNGLDIDMAGSLSAHEGFCRAWDLALERETDFLRGLKPTMVLGDIPPLAFAAAARAGVGSVAVSNFSWDWILEQYLPEDERWRPVIARYREAYAGCEVLFRLPFHGIGPSFERIIDAPLVARRARLARERVRRALGIEDGDNRRLVLVSFGGLGSGPLRLDAGEDSEDILFAGPGPAPQGLRARWLSLPPSQQLRHVDVVAACEAVITKPGYGIVSECLAHGIPVLFLPKTNFRESPVLARGLLEFGRARSMPTRDFFSGHWRGHLEALWSSPGPARGLALNGADFIAERILAMLE